MNEHKREYPLFLIDRYSEFTYITCLDREVGYVAKILICHDDATFNMLHARTSNADTEYSTYCHRLRVGGIALVVLDFLYHFEANNQTRSRVQVLLKKALKKYLHATSEREMTDGELSIDNQIKQQKITIERARANYAELVKRSPSPEDADYAIKLAEETLHTLENYKSLWEMGNLIEQKQ